MTSTSMNDVVLKLGLVRQGAEAVFRRVPVELLSLTDATATTGIDIIKKFAVLMFEGTSDITTVNLQNYSIVLMYQDLDDDKVLMYTDYDIIVALKEYTTAGKLKILAEVATHEASQQSSRATVSTQTFVFKAEPFPESSSQDSPCKDSAESATEQHTASNPTESPPTNSETPNVLPPELTSSLANILHFAANAATSAAHSAATSVTVTEALNKAAAAVEEQAKKVSAAAEAKARTAQTAVNQAAQNVGRNTERAARQAARCARKAARHARRTGSSPEEVVNLESVGNVESIPRNAETTSSESNPNLTVEPVTTGRLFIHGRHTCDGCLTTPIIGKRFHAVNLPDYDLCERCMLARTGESNEFHFQEMLLDRDMPMQDRWHARRARLLGRRLNTNACGRNSPGCTLSAVKTPVPSSAPQQPPHMPLKAHSLSRDCFAPEDLALEEAIRRSLEDQKAETDTAVVEPAVEVETVLDNDSLHEETSAPANVDTETSISVVAQPLITVDVVVVPDVVAEPEIVVEPTEIVGDSDRSPPVATAPVEPVPDDVALEKADFCTFVADGEGATAHIIGSTLDKMAEAIEGLTWQLDHPVQTVLSNSEGESSSGESTCSSDAGEQIMDGEVDFDDDDSGSWHVVPGDEHLGRMASTLGCALFNSEMQRSNEALQAPTKSVPADVFDGSTVSSIATSVANLTCVSSVPSALLERWSTQLNQLHELGFDNDQQSVDILENLSAANIGVDNNEEVSVERVINAIMKD